MENLFTKIGSYQYSAEALIIKGRLESEGIEVFMADNITIDVDPFISNAIGGVKLFVKTKQLEQAVDILSQISKYSLNDEGNLLLCRKCESDNVEVVSTIRDKKAGSTFLFSLLLGVFPFYVKYKYRCNNCNNEFNIK